MLGLEKFSEAMEFSVFLLIRKVGPGQVQTPGEVSMASEYKRRVGKPGPLALITPSTA